MNNCLSAIEAITKLLFLPKSVPERADVCIVLGNDYLDTMVDVKSIYEHHVCDKFILTGHSAKMDKEPECERFFRRGIELGIPSDIMFLENKATNSYENLNYSKQIIEEQFGGFEHCKKILFVAKAFVTRRIEMTAKNLYPDFVETYYIPTVDDTPTGKNIGPDNWWINEAARKRVLEEVKRIAEYTLKGYLTL